MWLGFASRPPGRETLQRSAADASPTAYVLERIEVGRGNERLVTRGTWATTAGPGVMSCATVVELDGSPNDFGRYLMVGDDVLLMLDSTLSPCRQRISRGP